MATGIVVCSFHGLLFLYTLILVLLPSQVFAGADWSKWLNTPQGKDGVENETITRLAELNKLPCAVSEITDVQCKNVYDNQIFQNQSTFLTNKLRVPCNISGLLCVNEDQTELKCEDYEVRVMCGNSTNVLAQADSNALSANGGYIAMAAGGSVVIPLVCVLLVQLRKSKRNERRRREEALRAALESSAEPTAETSVDCPPTYVQLFGSETSVPNSSTSDYFSVNSDTESENQDGVEILQEDIPAIVSRRSSSITEDLSQSRASSRRSSPVIEGLPQSRPSSRRSSPVIEVLPQSRPSSRRSSPVIEPQSRPSSRRSSPVIEVLPQSRPSSRRSSPVLEVLPQSRPSSPRPASMLEDLTHPNRPSSSSRRLSSSTLEDFRNRTSRRPSSMLEDLARQNRLSSRRASSAALTSASLSSLPILPPIPVGQPSSRANLSSTHSITSSVTVSTISSGYESDSLSNSSNDLRMATLADLPTSPEPVRYGIPPPLYELEPGPPTVLTIVLPQHSPRRVAPGSPLNAIKAAMKKRRLSHHLLNSIALPSASSGSLGPVGPMATRRKGSMPVILMTHNMLSRLRPPEVEQVLSPSSLSARRFSGMHLAISEFKTHSTHLEEEEEEEREEDQEEPPETPPPSYAEALRIIGFFNNSQPEPEIRIEITAPEHSV